MVNTDNVGAAILVGGKSRRMGYNKVFLKIGKQAVLKDTISKLSTIFSDISLVGSNSDLYLSTGLNFFVDIYNNCGPLGGIHSALYFTQKPYVFICACDMPFIEPKLVEYMARNILDYDIVVPYIRGGTEPLYAIYSRNCLDIIAIGIMSGQVKISDIFEKVKTRYIERDEIEKITDPDKVFINLNTPADVDMAKSLANLQALGESIEAIARVSEKT